MRAKPQILRKISREFNKYRFPECRVRIIKNENGKLVAEFTGTAAKFSCCFDEYFEDYRLMLEDYGEKYEIENLKEKRGRFIVVYKKAM